MRREFLCDDRVTANTVRMFSGESAAELCDAVYYSDACPRENLEFRAGQSVFCKTEQVPRLFERLRLTRKRVVLVSGESDFPCDERLQRFLPPQVAKWFATNVTSPHPRVSSIPLGIGRRGDLVTPSELELQAHYRPAPEREMSLYINFRTATNEAVRRPVFDALQRRRAEPWLIFCEPAKKTNAEFLAEMMVHRFVLCPPGNGVDTHRFWETLATGGVPVAFRNACTRSFEYLPVVLVDSCDELSMERLQAEWQRLAPRWQVPQELAFDFWLNRVAAERTLLARRPQLSAIDFLRECIAYAPGMIGRRIFRKQSND